METYTKKVAIVQNKYFNIIHVLFHDAQNEKLKIITNFVIS